MRTFSDKHQHYPSVRPQLAASRSLSASNITDSNSNSMGAGAGGGLSLKTSLDVSAHGSNNSSKSSSSSSKNSSTCSSPSSPNKLSLPFGDLEQSPDGKDSYSGSDESSTGIAVGTAEELEKYNSYITKFHESVAKVEKDYNHVVGSLSSQGEKLVETYKREYERVMNRKDDLTVQLHAMEDKYKERMLDLDQRREELYQAHMLKYRSHQTSQVRNVLPDP